MTLYGVIVAALVRKVKALVAEYRKLVAEASATEEKIVSTVKSEVKEVFTLAKLKEQVIVDKAEFELRSLKNDLIDKIAKI